jgi:hypothetical protein
LYRSCTPLTILGYIAGYRDRHAGNAAISSWFSSPDTGIRCFSVGGNAGIALGPLIVTPVLLATRLDRTSLLALFAIRDFHQSAGVGLALLTVFIGSG